MPVAAQSAMEARSVAERSLAPTLIAPSGQAELLKIIGSRNESEQTPPQWTFYFFDKSAGGHAKVVTVRDEKVVNDSERTLLLFNPFEEKDILPDEVIDSNQALLTAEALVPGVTVSSSDFVLVKKDSVPVWKIRLWAKDEKGDEQELGSVTILADKNISIGNTLKPERVTKP
jgi:hypothetical protein